MAQHRQYPDAAAKQRAYRARQLQARLADQQAKGLPPAPPLPTLPSRARWQALLAGAPSAHDQLAPFCEIDHTGAQLSLQTAHDEMQAYFDDRSEAWQESERADALQERLDAVAQILDDLDALPPC